MSSSLIPLLLNLPLQYEPDGSAQVRQHWKVTFSRQRKISVLGKRILARVLEQIKEDDLEFRDYYQLRVSSLIEDTSLTPDVAYKYANRAMYELAQTLWEFEDPETNEWYFRPLLDGTKPRRVGIKDGVITIMLNPELAPYFINIAGQYSTYKIEGYMQLHSWYSMRLFEILSAFRDTGWWEVSLDEFRLLMDCGPELDKSGLIKRKKNGQPKMKLPSSSDLISRTILPAQKELSATANAFDYQALTDQNHVGRGRPKILGLRFTLHQKQLTSIPPSWMAHTETAAVVNRLRNFKVTDKNIACYLKIIALSGAKKLLREWELKENSSQRIDDKSKYCNAVLVRVGKQAIEIQRQEALQAKQYVQQTFQL